MMRSDWMLQVTCLFLTNQSVSFHVIFVYDIYLLLASCLFVCVLFSSIFYRATKIEIFNGIRTKIIWRNHAVVIAAIKYEIEAEIVSLTNT